MMKKYKYCLVFFLVLSSFNLIESSLKFTIPSYKDKCFQHSVYITSTLIIRYHLSGYEKDFNENEQKELFNNIKITIKKEESGQIVYETPLKGRKDKFPALIEEYGTYLICARYYKPRRAKDLANHVLLGIKLGTSYDYYSEVEHSLQKSDVQHFWKKIREIKVDMRPSIEAGKLEIKEEDKTAKSMIDSIDTYYKLCVVQLVIILLVTMYTVYMYQEFFKKKAIISK